MMSSRRDEPLAIPWWPIATVTLLAIALVISIAAGRTVEAVVIALLLVPSLLLLGAWAYSVRNGGR
jgi:hypothetical protein